MKELFGKRNLLTRVRSGLVAVLLLAAIGVGSDAQISPRKHTTKKSSTDQAKTPALNTDTISWFSVPWTGNDKPYQKIKAEIDQRVAQGQDLEPLIKRYKNEAEKGSQSSFPVRPNPMATYGWAYAAWKTITPNSSKADQMKHLEGVRDALNTVIFPKTYEYARLKFLFSGYYYDSIDPLRPVAKKLLLRNPSDYDVKYEFVRLLGQSASAADIQESISYATDLVKADPNRFSAYLALGGAYLFSYHYLNKSENKTKALAAYQKYLDISPPTNEAREEIKRLMSDLQSQQL